MDRPIRVWVNGAGVDRVSATDRGLQYGDGVFETVAVIDGQPLLWSRHLARLEAGCRALGFDVLPDSEAFSEIAARACRNVERGVLKCVVTRGAGGRGYRAVQVSPTQIVTLWPWPDFPATHANEGIALTLCRTRVSRNPALAGIKHLNRLEQVLARREWKDGFAEGVMLDESGNVIEGTMSNLFAVIGNKLLTPELSMSGVRGIMRACVLDCAAQLGIEAGEAELSLPMLTRADEVFMTNSIIGIWPVKRFNNQDYGIGKTTQKIQAALREGGFAP